MNLWVKAKNKQIARQIKITEIMEEKRKEQKNLNFWKSFTVCFTLHLRNFAQQSIWKSPPLTCLVNGVNFQLLLSYWSVVSGVLEKPWLYIGLILTFNFIHASWYFVFQLSTLSWIWWENYGYTHSCLSGNVVWNRYASYSC